MDKQKEQTMKFVVVLNKKIETGVALNAACHLAAALVNKATPQGRELMQFVEYQDRNKNLHSVSALSLIVLRADNSSKIRQARIAAESDGLLYVDFLESMTGGTYEEQMVRTQQLKEEELNYYGLCLFGSKEKIDRITSKFSLWR